MFWVILFEGDAAGHWAVTSQFSEARAIGISPAALYSATGFDPIERLAW